MKFIKITLLHLLLIHFSADAIVIRHDIDDTRYLQLGEQYSPSVGYVGGCAATLIDPGWLLTAAHCVAGREDDFFTARHIDTRYRIENIIVHPKFRRNNDEIYDAALVQLKDPITGGKPARLYRQTNEVGQPVIFVGRGTYGNGRDGLIRHDRKQRGATNRVATASEHVIGFTFDAPDKATEFEGISSRGDSGGPAFIEFNNQLYVIGISSYQEGNGYQEGHYGVGEYYTRVSSVYPWLVKTMDNAPPAQVARHSLIDAVKDNDLPALKRVIDDKVLADSEILTEAFYQSILLDRTPSLANVLLKRGAEFDQLFINDLSLFEYSLLKGRKAYFKMLQAFVDGHQNIHRPDSAVLPLFISTFGEDPYVLEGVQKLIKQGADLDSQTRSGDTALIIAGWSTDNHDLVKLLVTKGANINIPNNNGDTPLMDAAYLGKLQNLRYLVDKGADLSLKNKRGKTALQLARDKQHKEAVVLLSTPGRPAD